MLWNHTTISQPGCWDFGTVKRQNISITRRISNIATLTSFLFPPPPKSLATINPFFISILLWFPQYYINSSISGLYPLDANNSPRLPVMTVKTVSRCCQMPPQVGGGWVVVVQNGPWLRNMDLEPWETKIIICVLCFWTLSKYIWELFFNTRFFTLEHVVDVWQTI